jgi:hypothetical protein
MLVKRTPHVVGVLLFRITVMLYVVRMLLDQAGRTVHVVSIKHSAQEPLDTEITARLHVGGLVLRDR